MARGSGVTKKRACDLPVRFRENLPDGMALKLFALLAVRRQNGCFLYEKGRREPDRIGCSPWVREDFSVDVSCRMDRFGEQETGTREESGVPDTREWKPRLRHAVMWVIFSGKREKA
ncbi:hypothetical protein [Oxalobacter paraformigenes]|uniref:Uncharacterized protein n=1 Tax=Oxalobacter paraformigenes TaxID=556268 RepID=T5LUW4_9BURK|nr:hypothetical protein [Oxalobacter paraformigenes]EQM95278.1 hypothetical protein OFAG_02172 [Oxalobacter paraformigenes]